MSTFHQPDASVAAIRVEEINSGLNLGKGEVMMLATEWSSQQVGWHYRIIAAGVRAGPKGPDAHSNKGSFTGTLPSRAYLSVATGKLDQAQRERSLSRLKTGWREGRRSHGVRPETWWVNHGDGDFLMFA